MPNAHYALHAPNATNYDYNRARDTRASRNYNACTNKSPSYTLLRADGSLSTTGFLGAVLKCSDLAGNNYNYIGFEGLRHNPGKIYGKCYGLNTIDGQLGSCKVPDKFCPGHHVCVTDGYVDWDKVYILPNLNKMVDKTESEIKSKYDSLVVNADTLPTLNKTSTTSVSNNKLLATLATQDYMNSKPKSVELNKSLLDDINGNLNYTMMSMCIWVPLGVISGYYLYNLYRPKG